MCELSYERNDDGVVTVWLDRKTRSVVIIDSWLLDQLELLLDELDDAPPAGLIVTSDHDRVFAAGADLAEIAELPDDLLVAYLTEGSGVFERIATLPCPTVAAINGTAVGGGLELAMHCDALIAAASERPYRLGLPEAGLGLCPGWGGTQLLPARVDPAEAIALAATGQTPPLTEWPDGLVDEIVERGELRQAATAWIADHPKTRPSSTPRCIDRGNAEAVSAGLDAVRPSLPGTPAAHAVVEAVEIGIVDGFAAGLAAERRLLVSLRGTDMARERIEAFLSKNA